jgi:fibronectin type 3 domain-containing protein
VRRRLLLAAALWTGCGYVGDPKPPLLNIPAPVQDLAARQIGDQIHIELTIPPLTTEGEIFKNLKSVEIKVGPGGTPLSINAWADGAAPLPGVTVKDGRVSYETPAAPWVGKEVVIGANILADNGRPSGWSNLVSLAVAAPLLRPASVAAANVKDGVRVSWTGKAPLYRVFRQAPGAADFAPAAEAAGNEWLDTSTEYGKTYAYRVVAVAKTSTGEAVSEPSETTSVTPEDKFPPDPPAGIKAIASTATVELAWDPSPGAVSYGIYRSMAKGEWELVGTPDIPAYSDKPPQAGAVYRYAISARDVAGNEGAKSEPVEVTAP